MCQKGNQLLIIMKWKWLFIRLFCINQRVHWHFFGASFGRKIVWLRDSPAFSAHDFPLSFFGGCSCNFTISWLRSRWCCFLNIEKKRNPLKTAKRLQICCERSSSKPSSPRKMIRKRSSPISTQKLSGRSFLNLAVGLHSSADGLNKRQICWQE